MSEVQLFQPNGEVTPDGTKLLDWMVDQYNEATQQNRYHALHPAIQDFARLTILTPADTPAKWLRENARLGAEAHALMTEAEKASPGNVVEEAAKSASDAVAEAMDTLKTDLLAELDKRDRQLEERLGLKPLESGTPVAEKAASTPARGRKRKTAVSEGKGAEKADSGAPGGDTPEEEAEPEAASA